MSKSYDADGYFVSLKSETGGPKDGIQRHFYHAHHAVNFLAALQAGDREHGVVLIARRAADEPSEMALECLAADGWPTKLYSTSERRVL